MAGGHPWDCKSKAAEHAPGRSSVYVPEAGTVGRGPTVWFGILSPRQARVAAGDAETLKIAYKQRVRHPRLPDRGGAAPIWVRCRLSQPSHGAFDSWAEAEFALGRHTRVAEGINELGRRHPFHERLRSTQMPARYRSGRRADAPAFPALTHRTGPGPVRGHAAAPGP
ncbi:BTAD domain-containing putative transcriptional regulator [Streptomyces inhibens]|uniref:BTAD domain-containing putative transcriptional regulator n=1 Tax=Streptomyces inhibens TaxID=2293571 RepID=UPI0037A735B6